MVTDEAQLGDGLCAVSPARDGGSALSFCSTREAAGAPDSNAGAAQ
eukprot:SAG31_NODE_37413_length_304_cov_1.009756_1_plen_45_part_01